MNENDDFFMPEEIDDQIDALAQDPQQHHPIDMPETRVIEDLQRLYATPPAKQVRALDRAWERIVDEHRMAHQNAPEKGRLILMQEYQKEDVERPTLGSNQRPGPRGKRGLMRTLNLLVAVAVIGLLVGSMVFLLNANHQSTPVTKHSAKLASGGTPLPTPAHPITGGACTIDTTVAHPRESTSDLPGLYIFAFNNESDGVLYRYNPQTKAVVWSKKLCSILEPSGVVTQNGIVYVTATDWTHESQSGSISYLYALNEADGSALWGVQFPTDVMQLPKSSPNYGSTPPDMGMIEAPTVANGIVYIMQRSGIAYAYNAVTGARLWTFDAGRNAWATTSEGNGSIVDPSSIQVIDGIAYGSIVDRVFALDAKKGTKIWMHNFDNALNINQTPAIANGTLYLTAFVPGYGSVANPDTSIYAFDAHTGSQKWVSPKMRGYLNAPNTLNGGVYVMSYNAVWYTLNPSSGAIESQRQFSANSGPIGPTVINGVLYNTTGTAVYRLNPDGSTKWSAHVDGQYPGVADAEGGIVYVTTRDKGVYAYSATNGALLWHYAGYLPQPDSVWWMTAVS